TAGAVSAAARATAASITARWPRCTPSKLPIAANAPLKRATSGASSRTTMKGSPGLDGAINGRAGSEYCVTSGERVVLAGPKSSRRRGSPPRRHRNDGIAVEDQLAVDSGIAMQADDAALGDEFDHLDQHFDNVADLHRPMEVERLGAVNRAGTWEAGAQYGRDQARGVEPMGDALAEAGVGRVDVAEMQRIVVARESRETDHVGIHHGLHQALAHADVQILEIEDAQHARVDDGLGAGGHDLTKR